MFRQACFLVVVAAALAASARLAGGDGQRGRLDAPGQAADVYTCPMHPEVTDTKPSRCPKCKMKLVLR